MFYVYVIVIRDEKMVEYKVVNKKELPKGGVFKISEHELETLSEEFSEINNILALAKADKKIRDILLFEILKEFGDDLLLHYDNIIEDIIQGIVEHVNENIQIEGVGHNCNVEAYGHIEDTEKTKKWIKTKLGMTC